jgi:hypothetical protein
MLMFQALAQSQDLKLPIPPVKTSLEVEGQPVAITAWGEVARVSPDMLHLGLTADLGDLEANLTALLGSQLNRSERCGERLSVERASLLPAPPSGLLKASFHYERWACAKVLGREVAKRLAGGNGVVEVLLTPFVATDGISLTSEVRKIDADGSLGELLRAGSLGASVQEKLAASIQSANSKSGQFQDDSAPCGRDGGEHSQRAISRARRSPSAFSGGRCADHARSMGSAGEAA